MGLVGAGGAIFTVPLFGQVLGHGAKSAFVEALAVTGAIAAVSGAWAARRGLVDWPRAAVFAAAGIVGAQAAAPVAVRLDARVQVWLFASVAAAAAWRMWGATAAAEGTDALPGSGSASGEATRGGVRLRSVATGCAIGALTSLVGVGGGFVLIPALAIVERLPMAIAVGTSMVVIAVNASAGIVGQWIHATPDGAAFDATAVAITAACGIAGSFAGAGLQRRLPQAFLRRAFAVALVAAGAWMVLRAQK